MKCDCRVLEQTTFGALRRVTWLHTSLPAKLPRHGAESRSRCGWRRRRNGSAPGSQGRGRECLEVVSCSPLGALHEAVWERTWVSATHINAELANSPNRYGLPRGVIVTKAALGHATVKGDGPFQSPARPLFLDAPFLDEPAAHEQLDVLRACDRVAENQSKLGDHRRRPFGRHFAR